MVKSQVVAGITRSARRKDILRLLREVHLSRKNAKSEERTKLALSPAHSFDDEPYTAAALTTSAPSLSGSTAYETMDFNSTRRLSERLRLFKDASGASGSSSV